MFAARGHLALAGFVGYAIGRFGSQESGLAAIDLHSLKTELKVTRLALEETASHTCQAELHSEIRYSSSLRVVLQGCLVLQFALFIWSCCCLRIRRAARATPPVQQEASSSSSGEDSPIVSLQPVQRGPIRPSDLKKQDGRST